jgi:hypothetical protein
LHVREYVDVAVAIERLTYAYHYIGADGRFRFRYDNTDHHRRPNLPTHPHHKHDGGEEQVVASPAPDLAAVLAEIEALLPLPCCYRSETMPCHTSRAPAQRQRAGQYRPTMDERVPESQKWTELAP